LHFPFISLKRFAYCAMTDWLHTGSKNDIWAKPGTKIAVSAVSFGFSGWFGYLAYKNYRNKKNLLASGKRGEAVVTHVEVTKSKERVKIGSKTDDRTSKEQHETEHEYLCYRPTLSFKAEDGTQVQWIGSKTTTPIYEGDKIQVIYNPKNPNEIVVDTFGGIWGTAVALGIASVILGGIGLFNIVYL